MAAQNDARIWAVMAASGTGKGLWLKAQLRKLKPARLIVYDYKDEYQDAAPRSVTRLEAVLAAMLKAGPSGPLRLRYLPNKAAPGEKEVRAEFASLCSMVQAWGNCTFLAEELSNVTMPSWAPPAWRRMTSGGRHEGIHVIGVAQFPAMVDKSFLANATLLHIGPLHEHAHRQAVARSMDIELGDVADLIKFQYIEKDRDSGEITTGVIVPPGVAAPPTPRAPRRKGRGASGPSQAVDLPAVLPPGGARRSGATRRGKRPDSKGTP